MSIQISLLSPVSAKNTNLPSFITPRIASSLMNGAIFTGSTSRASPGWRLVLALVCLVSNWRRVIQISCSRRLTLRLTVCKKGAYIALERGLKNIYFIRARADQIGDLFALSTLVNIWVTFPDPFPKKRAAGRRLTHPYFLRRYAQLLQPGGELLFKHDDRDFFCWSLEQLVAEKWQITELSFDLHESSLDDEYKIMTTYEQRWLNEGKAINFVKATR